MEINRNCGHIEALRDAAGRMVCDVNREDLQRQAATPSPLPSLLTNRERSRYWAQRSNVTRSNRVLTQAATSTLAFGCGAWRPSLVEALQENSELGRHRLLRHLGVQHPKLLADALRNDAPHFRFLAVFTVHIDETSLP